MKPRKRTDTGYPITATLKAWDPTVNAIVVVNLSGSQVFITLTDRATRVAKVLNATCAITDATNGKVSYQPLAADVDTSASYDVEWKQVKGDSTINHYPTDGYEPLVIQDCLG